MRRDAYPRSDERSQHNYARFRGISGSGDCTDGTIDVYTGACVGGSYADLNASGLQQAIGSFVTMTNLDPSFSTMTIEAFRGARDLHMEPDCTLSPCSGANNTSTNRNSVSVALNVDAL